MLGPGAVDAPELDAAVAEGVVVLVEVDEQRRLREGRCFVAASEGVALVGWPVT